MFKNNEELLKRLEKGRLDKAPSPINNLNRSGDMRGKNPSPHLDGNRTGRGEGNKELPENLRSTIGTLARVSGVSKTADAFGLNYATVQDAKFGTVSGRESPSESLVQSIEKELKPIRNAALEKMLMAIDNITEEKIAVAKPGELSRIAANLSQVIKNSIVPNFDANDGRNNQVVIYAPHQKPESEFDTIEVGSSRPN